MWYNKFSIAAGIIFFFSIVSSCKSEDKKAPEAASNNDNLFYDYKIIAEEGNDNLLVMAQLKEESESGEVIPLSPDASLMIDGEVMEKESAKVGGEYYEAYRAIDSFAGSHSITYSEAGKEINKADFDYAPFYLQTELGTKVSRKAFTLSFAGLDKESDLRIVLTDTSYASEGVNELWQVTDSILTISPTMLANIKNGPVQLSLTREKEKRLKGGGRILSLYSINREFVLVD